MAGTGAKTSKNERGRARRGAGSVAAEIICYAVFALAVIGAFALGSHAEGGAPRMIAGFAPLLVDTGSMQREIPIDSIVLVKRTGPAELKIGDDITYVRPDGRTVTHRIVQTLPDYEGSGMTGFQTKGLENPEPDREIVYENNVVGKVVWHSAPIGKAFRWIRGNVLYVSILCAITIAFFTMLKLNAEARKAAKTPPKKTFVTPWGQMETQD